MFEGNHVMLFSDLPLVGIGLKKTKEFRQAHLMAKQKEIKTVSSYILKFLVNPGILGFCFSQSQFAKAFVTIVFTLHDEKLELKIDKLFIIYFAISGISPSSLHLTYFSFSCPRKKNCEYYKGLEPLKSSTQTKSNYLKYYGTISTVTTFS